MAPVIDQTKDMAFIQACKNIGAFFRLCAEAAVKNDIDGLVKLRSERIEEISALFEGIKDDMHDGVGPTIARAVGVLGAVVEGSDSLPQGIVLDFQEACLFVFENAAFIENELRLELEANKKVKSKSAYLIDGIVFLLVLGIVVGLGSYVWKTLLKKPTPPPAPVQTADSVSLPPVGQGKKEMAAAQVKTAPVKTSVPQSTKKAAPASASEHSAGVYFVFAPGIIEKLEQHAEVFLSQLDIELAQIHKELPVSRSLLPLDELEELFVDFDQPSAKDDISLFKKLSFLSDEYNMTIKNKNVEQVDALPGFIVAAGNENAFFDVVERVAQKFCVRFSKKQKDNVVFIVFDSYALGAVGFVEHLSGVQDGTEVSSSGRILPADALITSMEDNGKKQVDFIFAGRDCDAVEWKEIMGRAQQGHIGPNPVKAPVLDSILSGEGEITKKVMASLVFSGSFIAQCNMSTRGCVSVQLERGRLSVSTKKYSVPVSCVHVALPGQGKIVIDENTVMDFSAVSAASMVPGKQYEWSVDAVDSTGNVRSSERSGFRFVGAADVPSLVSAVSPSEGKVFRETNRNITLDWTDATCKSARIKYYDVWLLKPDGSREVFTDIQKSLFSFPFALPDSDYRWMVVAHSDLDTLRLSGGNGWKFSVRSSFQTPSVPVPVSPALDEVVQTSPVLTCSVPPENIDPASPVSYLFEVDTSDGFNTQNYHASPAVRPQHRDTVSWSPNKKLGENVRWYWRCKATNGILQSKFCPTSWFSVRRKGQPVEKIVMVRPHDGMRLTPDSVLEWEPVNYGPHVRYSLIIDSGRNFHDPDFKFDSLIGTKMDLNKIKDNLKENQKYYWMVRAYDSFSQSLVFASDIRSFIIDSSNDKPNEFALLFPVANSSVCAGGGVFVWAPAVDNDIDDTVSYSFKLFSIGSKEPLFVRDKLTKSVFRMKFDAHLSLKKGKAVFIQSGTDIRSVLEEGCDYSVDSTILTKDKKQSS